MIVLALPWLMVLLPLPLLVGRLLPAHRERRDAVYAPFTESLSILTGTELGDGAAITRRSKAQAAAFALAWVFLVLAIARPQFIGTPIEQVTPARDLLLAVDLSGSMLTEDFTNAEGDTVDRLTATKEVLDAFLAQREGDRVGLIVFGSAPFLQVPFTVDLDTCRVLLAEAQAGMAGPRTVVGDAIGLAITVFESSELDERVLIVLTDGNDTGSRVPPSRAAEIARDRGITIHTVAVGDPTSLGEEKIDAEALESVSEATGGTFARADNRAELEAVYSRLDEIEARDIETVSFRPQRDLFHWPLAAYVIFVFGFHGVIAIPRWLRMRREGDAVA